MCYPIMKPKMAQKKRGCPQTWFQIVIFILAISKGVATGHQTFPSITLFTGWMTSLDDSNIKLISNPVIPSSNTHFEHICILNVCSIRI